MEESDFQSILSRCIIEYSFSLVIFLSNQGFENTSVGQIFQCILYGKCENFG